MMTAGSALSLCLANAFNGCTLAREAQAAELMPSFRKHLSQGQMSWLDELAPLSVAGTEGRKWKLAYSHEGEPDSPPETQVKLTECFELKSHPMICESKVPILLWLHLPDGKRVASTSDWPAWREKDYPKLRSGFRTRFPSLLWP